MQNLQSVICQFVISKIYRTIEVVNYFRKYYKSTGN
jgi:hypothetical protein